MGMERRWRRKYYYRSRRKNGRVVKEYVGSGEKAEEAAKNDTETRRLAVEAAKKFKEEERARRAELKRIARIFDVLRIVIDGLIETEMTAAGYHRHDRGPWRKKRVAT